MLHEYYRILLYYRIHLHKHTHHHSSALVRYARIEEYRLRAIRMFLQRLSLLNFQTIMIFFPPNTIINGMIAIYGIRHRPCCGAGGPQWRR